MNCGLRLRGDNVARRPGQSRRELVAGVDTNKAVGLWDGARANPFIKRLLGKETNFKGSARLADVLKRR